MKTKLCFLSIFLSITYISSFAQVNIGATSYPTLKAAFDDINAGVHTGAIVITISASTTESAAAVLNASGMGSSNYSSVLLYPVTAAVTVSGTLTGQPVIDLNGADNVTIDGRINGNGNLKDLAIINASASTTRGTSTIRLKNDASNNIITYCAVKGSCADDDSSGVIMFSGGTVSGNDNNTISFCDLTSEGMNRPGNLIYSEGLSLVENDSLTITSNNFYNYIKAYFCSGIYLCAYTGNVFISNNSFYETDPITVPYTIVHCIRSSFVTPVKSVHVTNNYFGGSQPQCGGLPWRISTTSTNYSHLNIIYLPTDTFSHSSIQGNVISNIGDSTIPGNVYLTGILLSYGSFSVGDVTPNIIGDATGNPSIYLKGNQCIQLGTGRKSVVSNNIIGGITSFDWAFTGIGISMDGDTCLISNNTIGSLSIANSIDVNGSFYGIHCTGSETSTVLINNNSISNIINREEFWGLTYAISVQTDLNASIENNLITKISGSTGQASPDLSMGMAGIYNSGKGLRHHMNGNVVTELHNMHPLGGAGLVGIYSDVNSNATIEINKNLIGNFTYAASYTSGDIALAGILINQVSDTAATVDVTNNIISLDSGLTIPRVGIAGIYESGNGTSTLNYYFNTVFIGGQEPYEKNSFCYYSTADSSSRIIKNNIFYNHRSNISNTPARHYAIGFATSVNNTTINYNDYFIDGNIGALYGFIGADFPTFADLQNATGQDLNSANLNPGFFINGGVVATNFTPTMALPGISISGITDDYNSDPRPAVPEMGALELNSVTVNETLINQGVRIHPNPASDVIYISLLTKGSPASIFIYDMQGNIVYRNESMETGVTTSTNISLLPGGIYMLRAICEEKYYNSRFLKAGK